MNQEITWSLVYRIDSDLHPDLKELNSLFTKVKMTTSQIIEYDKLSTAEKDKYLRNRVLENNKVTNE